MITTFTVIAFALSMFSFLPDVRNSHWFFRTFDFIRIQVIFIQLSALIVGCFFASTNHTLFIVSLSLLSLSIIYQIIIVFPYLPFSFRKNTGPSGDKSITVISVNVLQKNTDFQKLIDLVNEIKPDILLTMETNKKWEEALKPLEKNYAYNYKVPKENRYGMHLYTNLKLKSAKEHYFISDDRPAIEAHIIDKHNNEFIFFGIHPPPPSPTEKTTADQKDAELMKVAKLVRKKEQPCLVTGDFNNVCWSRSAKLFSQISELKDARIGNGIHATFPATSFLFRFPLDLLFCSPAINVSEIKTLKSIGSDHFPLFAKFDVTHTNSSTKEELPSELDQEADILIKEGHQSIKKEEESK